MSDVHPALPFFLYGTVCIFGFIFILVFLPETHNKTAEETAKAFESPMCKCLCCCCHKQLSSNSDNNCINSNNNKNNNESAISSPMTSAHGRPSVVVVTVEPPEDNNDNNGMTELEDMLPRKTVTEPNAQ